MPRGASPKREREYNELKHRFQKEGRYQGREEEVASRIVNKQRSEFGETKAEKKEDREGRSPDRALPIRKYRHKTVGAVRSKLRHSSKAQIEKLEGYEKQHKNRKSLVQAMEKAKRR